MPLPKASQLHQWNPYKIVQFWSGIHHQDQDQDQVQDKGERVYQELPGFIPCGVLQEASKSPLLGLLHEEPSSKDLCRFVHKLYRNLSYEALCMLTSIELAFLEKDQWSTLDDETNKALATIRFICSTNLIQMIGYFQMKAKESRKGWEV
jgi:hypothetical protein